MALLRRASYWPPSTVYISVINTQTLQITFLHEMPKRRIHIGIKYWNDPVTFFHWKILALARIWTWDLPGTKPICYQLSYPGLDNLVLSNKEWIVPPPLPYIAFPLPVKELFINFVTKLWEGEYLCYDLTQNVRKLVFLILE